MLNGVQCTLELVNNVVGVWQPQEMTWSSSVRPVLVLQQFLKPSHMLNNLHLLGRSLPKCLPYCS